MSYYDNSQWPAGGQSGWDHQTPPVRSGASSTVPREESAAFTHQFEEVDRAVDNLMKSGKMFQTPGRRESHPPHGPARMRPDFDGRMGHNAGGRPHSGADYGDARGGHGPSNLQNFYANQRHQSSRGSNEAEQMMQAKRRMAAQRERELRNYHQEQQYNRTVLADVGPYANASANTNTANNNNNNNKPDRTLSPGSMSEDDRRDLIARQRSALYGEGLFAETGGYVDETGTPRTGNPASAGPHNGPATMRGHSPLAYEYEGGLPGPAEGGTGSQSAGPNQRSRANSTSSPQSNPAGSKGMFDVPGAQQSTRTSNSSPTGGSPGTKSGPGGNAVAPIGTRPSGASSSASGTPMNPALNKRSTTPLPSPLSHGFSAPGGGETTTPMTSGASNPPSAAADGSIGLSGWGGRSGVWGNGKSGLGVQASVWG